jgi:hypothetical protein
MAGHRSSKKEMETPGTPGTAEVEDASLRRVQLMSHEVGVLSMMPSITTATLYRYSDEHGMPAVEQLKSKLRSKVRQLLLVNPWLAGRLSRTDGGGVLSYAELEAVSEELLSRHLTLEGVELDLGPDAPYADIVRALGGHQVQAGLHGEEVFKVVLCRMRGMFALVVSLSHVVGDGYTYYRLYGMLDADTPVTALTAVRPSTAQFAAGERGLVGDHGPAWLGSVWFHLGMGLSLLLLGVGGARLFFFRVDSEWVRRQKACHRRGGDGTGSEAVSFVSSNDILTCWFARLAQLPYMLMSVNLRTRVREFSDAMTGNLITPILYATPSDFASPASIRRSLTSFQSDSRGAPSALESVRWRGGVVTNWATFYTQIDPSGGEGEGAGAGAGAGAGCRCEHIAHFPLVGQEMHVWAHSCIIFCIDRDTLGLLVGSRSLTRAVLESEGEGVSEGVGTSMAAGRVVLPCQQ